MGSKKKRGSEALKKYWRDIHAAKGKLHKPTKDVRRGYKEAKQQGFDRADASRQDLFDQITRALGGEQRLGETVFMDIDQWMGRATEHGWENNFDLQFYDGFTGDLSKIRSDGDAYFHGNPELGAPSFYWRIRLPIAVYFGGPKGLEYYRYVWPDTHSRVKVKSKKRAVADAEAIMGMEDLDDEEREMIAKHRNWKARKTAKGRKNQGRKGKWKSPPKGKTPKKGSAAKRARKGRKK